MKKGEEKGFPKENYIYKNQGQGGKRRRFDVHLSEDISSREVGPKAKGIDK